MLFSHLESIRNQIKIDLAITPHVKRIRVSPLFYHNLCEVIDQIPCDDVYGLEIFEDPSVETYELQY